MESQSGHNLSALEEKNSVRTEPPDRNSLSSNEQEIEEADGEPSDFVLPAWKRCLDVTFVILSFPLFLPVLGLIGLWVKLTSKGPILFRQHRIGLNGKPFAFYKFRSMKMNGGTGVHQQYLNDLVDSNKKMKKLDEIGDDRLIRGAKLLRAGGFDELPQLINVLRGEMSVVGPRPCTLNEKPFYKADQRRRFDVLPGITGYWQVKGKNQTTFTEMVEMDEFYADNHSLCLDLLIIFRTPAVLFLQMVDLIESRICKIRPNGPEDTSTESLK